MVAINVVVAADTLKHVGRRGFARAYIVAVLFISGSPLDAVLTYSYHHNQQGAARAFFLFFVARLVRWVA